MSAPDHQYKDRDQDQDLDQSGNPPLLPSIHPLSTTAHHSDPLAASASRATAGLSHAVAGAASGLSLPVWREGTHAGAHHQPGSDPFATPSISPIPTPLGSPQFELDRLTLGVERWARATADVDPAIGSSFSGTVPLPFGHNRPPLANRDSSEDANAQKKGLSALVTIKENAGVGGTHPLNVTSIKRVWSGKRAPSAIDLEQQQPTDRDNIDNVGGNEKKKTLSVKSKASRENIKSSPVGLESNATNMSAANDTVLTMDQTKETISNVRNRKTKGGVLSQLLKLHREAASSSAVQSPPKAQAPLAGPVKKTRKGFYYRSSRNASLIDHSPSVTTTPRVSPRNSQIFDADQFHGMSTTRMPTQPSMAIANSNRPDELDTVGSGSSLLRDAATAAKAATAATAATVATQLGIQRDIADILTRQSFLIMMAKSLVLYGAPSHRIEETCALLATKLELDASFSLLPGLLTVSFNDPETHTSDNRQLRCTQGMDLYKLSDMYHIALGVLHGNGIEESNIALEAVISRPGLYPLWVTVLAWMGSSAMVAPLAFNGSWVDSALAAVCGLIVGVLGVAAAKWSVYANVFEITSSIVVGFIARAFGDHVCFSAVALAGVVVLLPGLLLTQAIMELASRNIVSGAVRMFYALMYAFFLGFGLAIGAELWDFIAGAPTVTSSACSHGINPWWYWLVFPAVSTSINIVFNAHPSQFLGMTTVTATGFLVTYFMPKTSPQVSSAVAAFAVGISGQLYGRITGQLGYVPLLAGVLLLVPGSVGVRGIMALFGPDPAQGLQFALTMINVAMGITLGVFCSVLVVYPFWKKSSFMNF